MKIKRIKELRAEKGITQSQLADYLQIVQGTLSFWERGTHQPDFTSLTKISEYFNVSVDYLLGNTDIREKKDTYGEVSDNDIKFAFFGGEDEISDEAFEEVKAFAEFVKQREKQKQAEKSE